MSKPPILSSSLAAVALVAQRLQILARISSTARARNDVIDISGTHNKPAM